MRKTILFFMGLLVCSLSFGQAEVLKIQQVIDGVLKNNFSIQSAVVDEEVAEGSVSKGNAGLLPSVVITSGGNYSNNNTELRFAGGIDPANVQGAVNTGYNASLGLNYQVFNGFANLANYRNLQLQHELSETQLRLTIENAVVTATGLYLDAASLSEQIQALRETVNISQDQLKRIQIGREYGTYTSQQALQAKVDLHTDSMALLNSENQLKTLQRQINFLMGREITNYFQTDTSLPASSFELDGILSGAKSSNASLSLASLQKDQALISKSLAQANRYPTVNLTSSYGLSSSQNGAGIVLEQNNVGFAAGLNVSIPVFNGGKVTNAIHNAELAMKKSEIALKQNQLLVEKEVYDYWEAYQYQRDVVAMEKKNIELAELNLKRSSEAFKLGQITSIEYRQAQLNLLASNNRLSKAKYDGTKAAYQLLRLQGSLVIDQ